MKSEWIKSIPWETVIIIGLEMIEITISNINSTCNNIFVTIK